MGGGFASRAEDSTEEKASEGEDLADIKKQLAELQQKLSKLS